MATIDDTRTLHFADARAWEAWLNEHHATRTSVQGPGKVVVDGR